ncbi:hypothetical protein [Sphingomonas quercus]|uniref:Uncharacterized protein n=1 Tax=Sphingomonas quercus TaxID=2842451 RepID=A0ABS6BHS6_9SPHN|nr:hypothetical protein [Sphingomonas quercus]MBU3076780.1 hypothetical protein [Sphingomonas quercus]
MILVLAGVSGAACAAAETAPFDLTGPTLRVAVTRDGKTLPIAQVPQMATGDRIKVRVDLPADQSQHYLLVAGFLRGSTNPPPDKWFFKSEPWTKRGRDGLDLTVPEGAQQIILFLAPETGGDFSTLRNAVQGRPGAFVRAAQELAQASLDRSRLDAYLAAIRKTAPDDPERLARITPLLARSLQIKVDGDCLTKMPSLQAACLLQNQESLVLNDGHSNAITDAVAGPGADLALQLSATPQGGLGQYSPYIAAIRDVIGILSTFGTAKYQYIPALATLDGDKMNLVLNAAPSFHNPKSVLVTGLPIIAPTHVPPLAIPEATPGLCARASRPVLPMAGAPLIYATRFAHGMTLHAQLPDGSAVDLPATPDVEQGGLVIDTASIPARFSGSVEAKLHGEWGFEPFEGPSVTLQAGTGRRWQAAPGEPAGGELVLTGGDAACLGTVTAQTDGAAPAALKWSRTAADAVKVPLPAERPLTLTLAGLDGSRQQIALGGRTPARLGATIIARHVQAVAAAPVAISLANDSQIPTSATLTFSLRLEGTANWTGKERVEVTAEHGGAPVTLAPGKGLTILGDHVAVALLQPGNWAGGSAFGGLRARVVGPDTVSDWLPLGTLVRLPSLSRFECATPPQSGCRLTGDGLYLIQSVSTTPGFETKLDVPLGYPGTTLDVPQPADGRLYIRLLDAPDVANWLAA